MTNSPSVKFSFENRNVEVNEPSLGVTHVVARTTKGEPFKPDRVIKTLSEFKEWYGSEVTTNKTSDLELALKGGSMLRVSRVLGEGYSKGIAKVGSMNPSEVIVDWPNEEERSRSINFRREKEDNVENIYLKLVTKGYGVPFGTFSVDSPYGIKYTVSQSGINSNIYELAINLYASNTLDGLIPGNLIATYKVARIVSGILDISSLREFINTNPYFTLELESTYMADAVGQGYIPGVNNLDSAILYMSNWTDAEFARGGNGFPFTGITPEAPGIYYGLPLIGSEGSDITPEDWFKGYEALKDYSDGYQLIFSNIDESIELENDILTLYKDVKEELDVTEEIVLYVNVPSYNSGGTIKDYSDIITWVNSAINVIGNSRYVAYFAGGWKYINNNGSIVEADTIGTVVALGDKSASNSGPWYHFSGQNRGLVLNSRGIIIPNYGSPSNYDKLNLLANNRVNLSVIKQVPTYGMQPMLVHNFTSSLRTDSFRFLGVVRLCLYIKKSLRPRYESFLEEPNTFSTWKRMYFKAMEILEDLVEKDAITDLSYLGDQDATSYDALQINSEADVRQGKYKAIISFKDVVALQEIKVELILDAISGNVSVNFS